MAEFRRRGNTLLPWFLFPFAAHTLKIANLRQRSIFWFKKETFRGSIKQDQLLTKKRGPRCGQCLNQVFQHGMQTAGNLDALTAKVPDFRNGQTNKILPVGRPVNQPYLACGVSHLSRIQIPIADLAEEVMDLIQGENGRGRVVNSR